MWCDVFEVTMENTKTRHPRNFLHLNLIKSLAMKYCVADGYLFQSTAAAAVVEILFFVWLFDNEGKTIFIIRVVVFVQ